MSTIVQVPVEVTAEASARIAELGMQSALDAMIEYLRQYLPSLHSIELTEDYDYEVGGPPGLLLIAWRSGYDPFPEEYVSDREWASWCYRRYPPEIMRWLSVVVRYRGDQVE